MKTKHYRTCSICEALCGLELTVEDNQVVSIRGDADDVLSKGYLCPKGVAMQDLHTDPNRLRTPLKKTESGFVPIDWDTALNIVAEKLTEVRERDGRSAVAVYAGNPNAHNYASILTSQVLHKALGARSRFSATSADQLPHMFAALYMFGNQLVIPVPDVDHTDHMLILGGNPAASNGSLMTAPDMPKRLKAIRARGGKVVLFDPRRTETARLVDEHYFVKPGTDALLMMAWVNVLFSKNLVSNGPWANYVKGLDVVREVCKPFTPEAVSKHVGLGAETIERIIQEVCDAPSAAIYGRMGVCTQKFGGLSAWLLNVLNILTGNLDRRGGVMFTKPAVDFAHLAGKSGNLGHFNLWQSRVSGLPEFGGELPVSVMAEEIDTPGKGQIRALVTLAGNPVLSTPNGKRLDKALDQLEFMVSVDMYLNETTRHADIILPTVSPLERDHFGLAFHNFAVRNTVKYCEPLFERDGDTKPDWEIIVELSKRLMALRPGKAKQAQGKMFSLIQQLGGPPRALDMALRFGAYGAGMNPLGDGLTLDKVKKTRGGVDLGPLQPCMPERLYTEDKLIDLAPEVIVADVERLRSLLESEQSENELVLIGRRQLRSNNSWLHNSKRLMGGKNRCTLLMHPDDAHACGVDDGDTVVVKSRVGSLEIPMEKTDSMMPGVVSIPHGFGHGKKGSSLDVANKNAGVSINDLTDEEHFDSLTGNAGFSGVPVEVKPVGV